MQTLQVGAEAIHKVSHGVPGLVDAIELFFGVIVGLSLGLLRIWNDFKPDVQDCDGEGDGEVDHEDCGPQLDHAEVFKVQVKHILSLSFLLGRFLLLLGSDLLGVLFEVELENVVDVGLLADSDVPLPLHQRVLAVLSQHLA